MKHLLAILILPFCVTSYGQRNNGIKRIIELNKVFDTIRIQEFDIKGNLIFWKYFPDDYGIAQILTYSYNRNKKTNYIWLHSNAGFIINEYVYDTITNKVITYGYVPKNSLKNGLAFINSVYSFNPTCS